MTWPAEDMEALATGFPSLEAGCFAPGTAEHRFLSRAANEIGRLRARVLELENELALTRRASTSAVDALRGISRRAADTAADLAADLADGRHFETDLADACEIHAESLRALAGPAGGAKR